jgi:hypothetical protein
VCAALCSSCGAKPVGATTTTTTPEVRASLATSVETAAGTWAAVPMGHLDQPLNTFWQLFFRPRGSAPWSDRASSLAVATNGGLILATQNGSSLAVGVLPANRLNFSPLLVTASTRTWSTGDPISSLDPQPDALAIDGGGRALALVGAGGATRVLASPASLRNWQTLATERDLADSAAGRACGLVAVTAVGYAATRPLIGASCSRADVVGIFAHQGDTWRLAGSRLPPLAHKGRVDVLGLQPIVGGLCALISVTVRAVDGGTSTIAACMSDSSMRWMLSRALPITQPDSTISFGPAGPLGVSVLVSSSGHPTRLALLRRPGEAWSFLPTPPAGTAAVTVGQHGGVDALAENNTTFTDWRFDGASHSWTRAQVMTVAIQFGSSG